MKRILFLLATLFTVIFTTVFTSCKKEELTEEEKAQKEIETTVKGVLKDYIEELPINFNLLDKNFRQNTVEFYDYRVNVLRACEPQECPKVVFLDDNNSKYYLLLHFMHTTKTGEEIYIYYPVKESVLYTIKNMNCIYIDYQGSKYKFHTLYDPVMNNKNYYVEPYIKVKSLVTADYSKPDCPTSEGYCFIESKY